MKEYVNKMNNEEMAIDRWENEGGQCQYVCEVSLFAIKQYGIKDVPALNLFTCFGSAENGHLDIRRW
jgi:hypothetical protein